jgi:hypothetical protein
MNCCVVAVAMIGFGGVTSMDITSFGNQCPVSVTPPLPPHPVIKKPLRIKINKR